MVKVQLKGWTFDGIIMILTTVGAAIGFIVGITLMSRVVNWDAHIETMVWNSYSSALAGCVQASNELSLNQDHKNWEFCVKSAQGTADDTREILTKDPLVMFRASK